MIEDQHERLRGHRIRQTLKRIPHIISDLEPTPKRGNGRGSSEIKLPISDAVLDASAALRIAMTGWARVVIEERDVPGPTEDTLPAIAVYLTYHSEWLGKHPAGQEVEDDLADAVANLERLIDRPAATVLAGKCPTCGSAVYAKEGRLAAVCFARNEDDEPCGTPVEVETGRAELLTLALGLFASASDIAAILPVKAATVRQWGKRGHLGGYCDVNTREGRWLIESVVEMLDRNTDRMAA